MTETVEGTLAALRRDLAEHGDQVQMFVPYIPLTFFNAANPDGPIPEGCVPFGQGYAREIDVQRAEQENAKPERSIRTSDMIRTLTRFNSLLKDVTDGQ